MSDPTERPVTAPATAAWVVALLIVWAVVLVLAVIAFTAPGTGDAWLAERGAGFPWLEAVVAGFVVLAMWFFSDAREWRRRGVPARVTGWRLIALILTVLTALFWVGCRFLLPSGFFGTLCRAALALMACVAHAALWAGLMERRRGNRFLLAISRMSWWAFGFVAGGVSLGYVPLQILRLFGLLSDPEMDGEWDLNNWPRPKWQSLPSRMPGMTSDAFASIMQLLASPGLLNLVLSAAVALLAVFAFARIEAAGVNRWRYFLAGMIPAVFAVWLPCVPWLVILTDAADRLHPGLPEAAFTVKAEREEPNSYGWQTFRMISSPGDFDYAVGATIYPSRAIPLVDSQGVEIGELVFTDAVAFSGVPGMSAGQSFQIKLQSSASETLAAGRNLEVRAIRFPLRTSRVIGRHPLREGADIITRGRSYSLWIAGEGPGRRAIDIRQEAWGRWVLCTRAGLRTRPGCHRQG